jgi:integrase
MPKLTHRLPKYSLDKCSSQAKVRHGGKTTYLGKHGSKESQQRYAEFIAKLSQDGDQVKCPEPEPVNLLVGECVLRYTEHADRYYVHPDGTPTSEPTTIRCSLRPLVERFGELPADQFKPARLEQVQADMIKKGWCRNYINKATNIIRRCFKWCAKRGYVRTETWTALTTVDGLKAGRTAARETAPIGPVSDEHVDAVLPHVSDVAADICRFMRLSGARPGEVLAMKAADLDRSDASLWAYQPKQHKTKYRGKQRAVFIGPRAQAVLAPYILKAGDDRLFPITRAALTRAINRGCKRAGIPAWAPNRIRHSVGTVVRAKFGLEAAQVLLGHVHADVTQTYAERDMAKARELARLIG